MNDDSELLRRYADERAEDAFAEIVRRHIGLVYHAALRQTGDASLAEEVTQSVFTDLARKAGSLVGRESIMGWLFTSARFAATKAKRGERRRQAREQEIFAMHEFTHDSTAAADWARLRPVIDEALHALDARYREAVLLRFFEGRPLAEVGQKLAVSEDTARVRVARALDKLQGLLARRGITSTTAALGVAMAGQAGAAVPVGLAVSVTSGAMLAATVAGGVGAVGILNFMSLSKTVVGVAGVIAVLSVATVIFEIGNRDAKLAVAAQQQDALRIEMRGLERRMKAAEVRAEGAENDNAILLRATETALAGGLGRNSAAGNGPLNHATVQARYSRALELARKGEAGAALKEYLWCFDDGMTRVSTYRVARRGALLDAMAKLGEVYPEALAVMRERRDLAERSAVGSTYDMDSALDFAALNRALGDDSRTLALYDGLPADDPRRNALSGPAFEPLMMAQRYGDAAAAKPYKQMETQFDRITKASSPEGISNREEVMKSNRDYAVNMTANSIEVLAGAGDLENARKLAGKLLGFDGTEQTKALLRARLLRAGKPGLLSW